RGHGGPFPGATARTARRAERPLPPRPRAVCVSVLPISDGLELGRDDVDDLAAATRRELDRAGREREQGVVAAAAHVLTGVEVRAALTDEDLAGLDDLAAEALDAEALRARVAAVAGGAGALLVCHVWCPSGSGGRCYLMPVIFTRVRSSRWPWRLRYPVLFLNLRMVIFGPRSSRTISAVTLTFAR